MDDRFLGHACFALSDGEPTVLIDPFLTGNPRAATDAQAFKSEVEASTSSTVVVLAPGDTHTL